MAAGVQLERGLLDLMKAQRRIDAQKEELSRIQAAAPSACVLRELNKSNGCGPEGLMHARCGSE